MKMCEKSQRFTNDFLLFRVQILEFVIFTAQNNAWQQKWFDQIFIRMPSIHLEFGQFDQFFFNFVFSGFS